MPSKRLFLTALLAAALSVLATGCASSTATPTPVPPAPTVTAPPAAASPTAIPTSSPVATKPAAATSVPTAAVKPAGTPAATPKTGRPALPAAAVIATAQWGFDSAYVYPQLPTDQSHSAATAAKIMDKASIQVLDAQVGWNAYPNETDGNLWYKVSYKDASGKDATGFVHASAVKFGP